MSVEHSPTRKDEHTTGGTNPDLQSDSSTSSQGTIKMTTLEDSHLPGAIRPVLDEAWISATQKVRLPQPLWREMPAHWFNVVEATFALNRITSDETKFRHILSNLDPTIIPFVTDLITDPPAHNKYDAIKTRIINAFSESKETKLRKLLRGQELGEDKPSHLLQRLRNLAGNNCTDTIIRSLFLEQLPESARSILTISPEGNLDTLAMQTDRILEAIKPQVALVKAGSTQSDTNNNVASGIQAEINEIRNMVEKLSTEFKRGRSRSNSKARYHNRVRSKSRDKTVSTNNSNNNNNVLCYYHSRFGDQARRCQKPCINYKETKALEN